MTASTEAALAGPGSAPRCQPGQPNHRRPRSRFDWDNGGAGSMQLRWRDGELVNLTISYET
jgi:hypothetical protein